MLICGDAAVAQSAPGQPATGQLPPSASEQFQAKIKELASALEANPRLKKLSQQQRENLVEFVTGNMLFVLLHELSHATVEEFHVPVLGRHEDAADSFAVVRLLDVKSSFSHRVLKQAAKGWFLSDRRDRSSGEPLEYYDEHSLDKQRAYQIVCFMVGSDPTAFADLAKETGLPEGRQESCKNDYAQAQWAWDTALKPHLRNGEQSKTKIEVTYGEAKGNLTAYAQGFHTIPLVEVVAEQAADQLAWPVPFELEVKTCGFINARWVGENRKLTLCYELAADFAELYRDFNDAPPAKRKRNAK
jgi:hypothetical protein